MNEYISGYTDEARYCPYCGERIYTYGGDGRSICEECGKVFYIVESEGESE